MNKKLFYTTAAIVVVAAVAVLLWGSQRPNATSNLYDYISDLKYTPFDIPRDKWGVGTVISIESDGSENIIWKNSECLQLTTKKTAILNSTPDIDTAEVTLPSNRYQITRGANLEVSLAKSISPDLKLDGAFDDNRVNSVEITIEGPKEATASDGTIKRRIVAFTEAGESCIEDIFREGNYVIDRVLSLEGFAFSFKTSSQTDLSLDADIMNEIHLDPKLQAELQGKSTLTSNKSRVVGYRLFKMEIEPGLAEGGIVAIRVDAGLLKKNAISRNELLHE